MSGHHFRPQSSLSSPIHAVKPSLSFKVVNYIVHCLLPKTIKPTLWTSRDFSQSVSNIGLYNLWQEGIFTNFSLGLYTWKPKPHLFSLIIICFCFGFFFWILPPTYSPHGNYAPCRREVIGGKFEKKSWIFLFSLSRFPHAHKKNVA